MASPRFLLVSGVAHPGEPARPWPGYNAGRGRLDGGVPAEVSPWTAWRLLGRNNRELGRSAGTYPTVPDCVAAVARLRTGADAASRLLSVGAEDGKWFWRLEVDGVPRAVSSRSYQRQRECVYSLEQFLIAVVEAEQPIPPGRSVGAQTPSADGSGADQGRGPRSEQSAGATYPARSAGPSDAASSNPRSREVAGRAPGRPLVTSWRPAPVPRRPSAVVAVPWSRRPEAGQGSRGDVLT